jgi:tyrosyl-DNA phosphodiesterase-1
MPSRKEEDHRFRQIPFWLNGLPMMPPATTYSAVVPPLLTLNDILDPPTVTHHGKHQPTPGQTTPGEADPEGWDLVVLSNYMTDLAWVLDTVPSLSLAKQIIVLYGESSKAHLVAAVEERSPRFSLSKFTFVKPPLPLSFGTHHSKAAFCFSPLGLRVGIFTANFILDDWNRKNQGLYLQDFPPIVSPVADQPHGAPSQRSGETVPSPRKVEAGAAADDSFCGSDFRNQLNSYLGTVGVGSAVLSRLHSYDFSAACVRLVASVPGYHPVVTSGSAVGGFHDVGLKRVGRVLAEDCPKEVASTETVLSWQYSSQGSLSEKFLKDLQEAMSRSRFLKTPFSTAMAAGSRHPSVSGHPNSGCHPDPSDVRVVFPSEDEVRNSVEGWRGGSSIPVYQKNCHEFVNARLHKFRSIGVVGTSRSGEGPVVHPRSRAMPHIKTYLRLVKAPPSKSSAPGATLQSFFPSPSGGNSERAGSLSGQSWWFLMTSANLSRAAWGEYQKEGKQLAIRSYELGVLYTAERIETAMKHRNYSFSLSPGIRSLSAVLQGSLSVIDCAKIMLQHGLFPIQLLRGSQTDVDGGMCFFLPYDAGQPEPYASTAILRAGGALTTPQSRQDVPWVLDAFHRGPDCLGQTFEEAMGDYDHYGSKSWTAPTLHFEGWTPPSTLLDELNSAGRLERPSTVKKSADARTTENESHVRTDHGNSHTAAAESSDTDDSVVILSAPSTHARPLTMTGIPEKGKSKGTDNRKRRRSTSSTH